MRRRRDPRFFVPTGAVTPGGFASAGFPDHLLRGRFLFERLSTVQQHGTAGDFLRPEMNLAVKRVHDTMAMEKTMAGAEDLGEG